MLFLNVKTSPFPFDVGFMTESMLPGFDCVCLYIPTKILIIKGQLISKCPFGVFKSPKKPTKFLMISALASKKRSNQKSSERETK